MFDDFKIHGDTDGYSACLVTHNEAKIHVSIGSVVILEYREFNIRLVSNNPAWCNKIYDILGIPDSIPYNTEIIERDPNFGQKELEKLFWESITEYLGQHPSKFASFIKEVAKDGFEKGGQTKQQEIQKVLGI